MSERELPRGWAWSTVGEIGTYQNGRAFSNREWSDSGRPIIRIQNLTGSGSTFNRFGGPVEERHVVRRGDLLVSWAATLGVFVWKGEEAALNQHIFKVTSRIDTVFHRYALEWALDSMMRETHGSGMVHITKGKFDATRVSIPPLNEQVRLVAELERRLSHVDAAVVNLKSAAKRVKALRGSIRNSVVTGALLGLDTTSWTLTTTGEVSDVKGGIQKQPKRRPLLNKRPFLRVANVGRDALDLSDIHEIELFGDELETYRLKTGDLLVVEGNGSLDQIGRAATWQGSISDCVHQNHLIRVRPLGPLSPRFLSVIWNAPSTIAQLRDVASSTSGLHTLSVGKVKAVQLMLPPLDKQAALVNEADRRFSLLDAVESTIIANFRKCAQLRHSLLAAAFSGKLVGQDPTDEPAEVLLDRIQETYVQERVTKATQRRVPTPKTKKETHA
jgi:type I restriction enzyme, S subunit